MSTATPVSTFWKISLSVCWALPKDPQNLPLDVGEKQPFFLSHRQGGALGTLKPTSRLAYRGVFAVTKTPLSSAARRSLFLHITYIFAGCTENFCQRGIPLKHVFCVLRCRGLAGPLAPGDD